MNYLLCLFNVDNMNYFTTIKYMKFNNLSKTSYNLFLFHLIVFFIPHLSKTSFYGSSIIKLYVHCKCTCKFHLFFKTVPLLLICIACISIRFY